MNSHSMCLAPEETAAAFDDNLQVLDQSVVLLEELDDELFAAPVPSLSLRAAGSHLRHCLDFYHSFLSGLPLGRVDYDLRQRDPRIEQDRLYALGKLLFVRDELARVREAPLPADLEVCLEGNGSAWSLSSVERELQFLLSHTIHHYALIAIALRSHGFDPGREFGVAPSTLRYWEIAQEAGGDGVGGRRQRQDRTGSRRQRQEAGNTPWKQ